MRKTYVGMTVLAAPYFGNGSKSGKTNHFFMLAMATCLLLFCSPAFAKLVSVGTITEASLGTKCDAAGGTFARGGTGYACTKANCDGKGGQCVVGCNYYGKCYGETPDKYRGGRGVIGNILGKDQLGTLRGHPVNAAPITSGKPVQASPGTEATHPILEREGSRGKH